MLALLCRQGMTTMVSCVASGARAAGVWARPAPAAVFKALPSRWAGVPISAAWVGGAAPLASVVARSFATSWPTASQAVDDIEEVDFEPGQANFVSLIGTTGRDVDLKLLERGARGSVPLAVEFKKGTAKETQWITVDMFGPLAERAASGVRKGTRVLVEGRLRIDTWQDKDTGAKRSAPKIMASSIKRVRKTGGSQAGAWGTGQQQEMAWPGAQQQQQQQQAAWPGSAPAQQAAAGLDAPGQTAEELWMELAQSPNDWVDYRAEKESGGKSPKHPDFKRRADGMALWITSRGTPAWVATEVAQGAFNNVPRS